MKNHYYDNNYCDHNLQTDSFIQCSERFVNKLSPVVKGNNFTLVVIMGWHCDYIAWNKQHCKYICSESKITYSSS